ncbi:MAG: hypothetical protein ACKOXV_06715 [Bacteroidota bacterium]|jgi:hypothetical protein
MTAIFTNFDSTMAEKIVVDSEASTVDVTFKSGGNTYRFELSEAEIADIVAVVSARSKGKLLHQLLDIRNGGVVVNDAVVAKPTVSTRKRKTATA